MTSNPAKGRIFRINRDLLHKNNSKMEQKDDTISKFYAGREERDAIHLKSFICKLISYWRWFIPSMIIGISGKIIYNCYTPATYAVTCTLFVE